ncbi:hypothetical protein [Brevundimonas sp.]|uniref:hypothetical protein n=1 Tax=Brevundimonas sp. TaxID=1871086 RepID=UPI0025C56BC2|nr:hypothetical protein [Brevundimonas sp.]
MRRRRLESSDIEDVIQETYALLASRARLDDLIHPKAYMFRVAHSRAEHRPTVSVRGGGSVRFLPFARWRHLQQKRSRRWCRCPAGADARD